MASGERDAVKEDVVGRAQELNEARASLANADSPEKVVREAYGEMSALAY